MRHRPAFFSQQNLAVASDKLVQVLVLLLQWTFYLVALATAAIVYRLTSLNSFVDRRKGDLQDHLTDKIREHPDLLTAIHHLGKIDSLRKSELRLFELLPGGFYRVVRQIYRLRAAYNWLVASLLTLLVLVTTLVVE
jgi:hypothetical protein